MCKIPERSVFESCVKDIITLLLDLSVVASSGMFTNNAANDNCEPKQEENNQEDGSITLMIFTETCREWDTKFPLRLNSLNSVLSIQSGVLHMLFLLLVMRQYGSPPEEDQPANGTLAIGIPHIASFVMVDELQSSFLTCLNQILLESMDPMGDPDNVRFMLENKVMASNLFLLLLPDLSSYTEEFQGATRITWTELIQITAGACKAHLLFLSTNGSTRNSKRVDDLAALLSHSISVLIRNTFFSPPSPFQPSVYDMWLMRKGTLHLFLDCIPLVSKVSLLSKNCYLCRNVIFALYITLNTGSGSVGQDSFKMELDELRRQVYTTCSLVNIFPSFFELLSVDSLRLLVAHLIAILSMREMDWELITHLCQDFILTQSQESNHKKKRRISQIACSTTGACVEEEDEAENEFVLKGKKVCKDQEDGRINLDNSFVQVFTRFFKRSLTFAQTILHHSSKVSISGKGREQADFDKHISGLKLVQMAKSIASSICLIESIFELFLNKERMVLKGLSSLYKGIQVISNLTAASVSSPSCTVTSESKSTYKELLKVIIGVFEKCVGNQIDSMEIDDARQEILLSLSHCVKKACLPSSQIVDHAQAEFLEDCHSEVSIFYGCATMMLHESDLDSLIQTMVLRLQPCSDLYSLLRSVFDRLSYINHHIVDLPYATRLGVQDLTAGKVLLQHILSLTQR